MKKKETKKAKIESKTKKRNHVILLSSTNKELVEELKEILSEKINLELSNPKTIEYAVKYVLKRLKRED